MIRSISLVLFVALLSAPAAADTFEVDIEGARALAALPFLCLVRKAQLDPVPDPWDADACMTAMAELGMQTTHEWVEARDGKRAYRQRLRDSQELLKPTPLPEP